MKLKEFRELLGCGFPMIMAVVNGDERKLDAVQAKVNAVHAQIDARKQQKRSNRR